MAPQSELQSLASPPPPHTIGPWIPVCHRGRGCGRVLAWQPEARHLSHPDGTDGIDSTAATNTRTEESSEQKKYRTVLTIVFQHLMTIMWTQSLDEIFMLGVISDSYPTAAVNDASLLCIVQSHFLFSFGWSDVLLVSEEQVAGDLGLSGALKKTGKNLILHRFIQHMVLFLEDPILYPFSNFYF